MTLRDLLEDPTFVDLVLFRDQWNELGLNVEVYTTLKLIELKQTLVLKDFSIGGLGNYMLAGLAEIADAHNRKILIVPTTNGGDASISRMKDFYKVHGFTEMMNDNKEYIGMKRDPIGSTLELDFIL